MPPPPVAARCSSLTKLFGCDYFLLYSTNPNYKLLAYTGDSLTPFKIILTSQIIFKRWSPFVTDADIILADEFRSASDYPTVKIIGLNATYQGNATKIILQPTVTSEKLQPIRTYIYELPIPKTTLKQICKTAEVSDHVRVSTLYPDLSYPFLHKIMVPSIITLGRKILSRRFGHTKNPDLAPNPGKLDNDYDYYLRRTPKFQQLLVIVKAAVAKGDKIMVFDRNIDFLPYLASELNKCNYTTYIFTTDYSPVERSRLLEQFKSGGPALLLCSYRMMSEGHNVPEANHIIFWAPMLTKSNYIQAIGRCQRFLQTKQVSVYHLFSSPIERLIYEYPANGSAFSSSTHLKSSTILEIGHQYGYWSYSKGYKPGSPYQVRFKPSTSLNIKTLSVNQSGTDSTGQTFIITGVKRQGREITIKYKDDKVVSLTYRSNNNYVLKGVGIRMNELSYSFN